MGHKIRGEAATQKPTEFELARDKKTGDVMVRAYHPGTGKKYKLLRFTNGGNGDVGKIVLHPRNQGLGFQTDRNGYPVTVNATV